MACAAAPNRARGADRGKPCRRFGPVGRGAITSHAGGKLMGPEGASKLTDISTIWQVVAEAQCGEGQDAQVAREKLFKRYSGAIHRYLMAALGDPTVVDDLTQEFALALVQGKFHQADPRRGRFRDYLKAVLFNLVRAYRGRE